MLTRGSLIRLLVAAILACTATLTGAQPSTQLPAGADFAALGKEARARHVPIVIAFVQKSCPYCAIAKRDYLVPLQRGAGSRGEVIVREVDIEQHGALSDFSGRVTNPKDFSRSYRVERVPTVVVVDDHGEPVAPALVGLVSEDFYDTYLYQAVEAGRARMRSTPRQRGAGAVSPR